MKSGLIKIVLIIGLMLGLGLFVAYGTTRAVIIYCGMYFLVAVNEILRVFLRQNKRKKMFAEAQAKSKELGKPLMVIGDPYNGDGSKIHGVSYGCGDVCVDLTGCPNCPNGIETKLPAGLEKIKDDSHVVFLSCVLEYVDDYKKTIEEIKRVGGNNVFAVTLSPYQLTSYLYQGAKNVFYKNPFTLE